MTKDDHEGRWRPMRTSDIEAVGLLSDIIHDPAYSEAPAVYAERVALYPSGCHVFERGGTIEGYLISHPWHRCRPPALDSLLGAIPSDADSYHLHDLALLPAVRGTGAGKAGLALVLRQAGIAGLSEVTLVAVSGAEAFWQAQRFAAAAGEGASPYGPGSRLMRRTVDGHVDRRLVTYGTLSPGRVNHDQLDGLSGDWRTGHIIGRLVEEGWGATMGFPAFVRDPAGERVAVHLFESADLPAHWGRLDAFEGDGYRRVIVPVETDEGPVEAWLYEALPDRGRDR